MLHPLIDFAFSSNWVGGGTTYTDVGGAASDLQASGADGIEYLETGTSTGIWVANGSDAAERTDLGCAIGIFVASGIDAAEKNDTGNAISVLTGTGADVIEYVEIGSGVGIWIGSGVGEYVPAVYIYDDVGCAYLVLVGSGEDEYIPIAGGTSDWLPKKRKTNVFVEYVPEDIEDMRLSLLLAQKLTEVTNVNAALLREIAEASRRRGIQVQSPPVRPPPHAHGSEAGDNKQSRPRSSASRTKGHASTTHGSSQAIRCGKRGKGREETTRRS